MEEAGVDQEKYAVIITPGHMTVIADVWDLEVWNEVSKFPGAWAHPPYGPGPLLTEVGQSREHAIRKLIYAIAKEEAHGYV